ncbi:unnamed protein product [Ectocarpus sp. 13 AM-2016]
MHAYVDTHGAHHRAVDSGVVRTPFMARHRIAGRLLIASIFVGQAVVTLGFIAPKAFVAVGRSAGEGFLGEILQKGLGRGQSCMVSSRTDRGVDDGATMRLGVKAKASTAGGKVGRRKRCSRCVQVYRGSA